MIALDFLDCANGEYFAYRKGCSRLIHEGESNIGGTFSWDDAMRLTDSYVWKVTVEDLTIRVECFNPNLPAATTLIADDLCVKSQLRDYIKYNARDVSYSEHTGLYED